MARRACAGSGRAGARARAWRAAGRGRRRPGGRGRAAAARACRNRQGFDIGSQYRSAIFFASPEQEAAATRSRDAQQAALEEDGGRTVSANGLTTGFRLVLGRRRRVVTEITAATTFWPAEDHHQRYLEKRGQATCAVALRS